MKKQTRSIEDLLKIAKDLQKGLCTNHTGKMEGIASISTSVLLNKQCLINSQIDGSICSQCYAIRKLKTIHRNNAPKLARNTELLTREVLPLEVLPTITNMYFRFEAFGDLNNAIQVVNYFNICNKNKLVKCALWTKNPHLIEKAMKEYNIKKPSNLTIVYSSIFKNTVTENIFKKYAFIDKVFTVYTKDYIKENNVKINCEKSCKNCLKCYKKNNIKYINEEIHG